MYNKVIKSPLLMIQIIAHAYILDMICHMQLFGRL